MPTLDWSFYPHIFESILEHVLHNAEAHASVAHGPLRAFDDSLLRALRLTHRSIRDTIDRRVNNHAVTLLEPPVVYSYVGGIKLSYDAETAARVRVLDVHPGFADKHEPPADFSSEFQYLNAKYVRLFSESCARVLDHFVGENAANLTVIYPLVNCDPLDEHHIPTASLSVPRIITLLPVYTHPYSNYTWTWPESTVDIEDGPQHIIVYVPIRGASDVPEPRGKCQPRPKSFVYGVYALVDDVLSSDTVLRPRRTIHVGFLDSVEIVTPHGFADEPGLGIDEPILAMTEQGKFYDTRCISWQEWRDEVPKEEWDLMASIPGVCWDACTARDEA